MEGDERRRHCATCDHDVINISALTEREAERVITGKSSPGCVRYRYNAVDGEVSFRPSLLSTAARHAGAAALATMLLAAPVHADASITPTTAAQTHSRARRGPGRGEKSDTPTSASAKLPPPATKKPAPQFIEVVGKGG